jgi:hypothetical protein
MKQKSKILIGVAVVVAVMAGAYFTNVGGLQGCIGRGCTQRSAPVDLSVNGIKIADTSYNGVPYYRVTVSIKSNASVATDWNVNLNGYDYTKIMGWQTVPAKTNTDYSFDIMQSVACSGLGVTSNEDTFAPSVSITLDSTKKVVESNENNNWGHGSATSVCPNVAGVSRGDAVNLLYTKLVNSGYKFTSTISTGPVFIDVSTTSPYFTAVQKLYGEGFIAGYVDGTFNPGKLMTRAEAGKLMTIAAPQPKVWLAAPYVDVPDTAWYGGANGLVSFIYSRVVQQSNNFGYISYGDYFFPNAVATSYYVKALLNLW